MWLGEQITERGIGNGISMIILAGIVAGYARSNCRYSAARAAMARCRLRRQSSCWSAAIAAIIFVVYMERAQRRITVNYARRQQGARCTQRRARICRSRSICRASFRRSLLRAILMFPATIAQFFGGQAAGDAQSVSASGCCRRLARISVRDSRFTCLLYAPLIIFFCFFYTALMFNSKDTADNLKRARVPFVPGIRPGAHTAEYIDRVLTRLTFWGCDLHRRRLSAA